MAQTIRHKGIVLFFFVFTSELSVSSKQRSTTKTTPSQQAPRFPFSGFLESMNRFDQLLLRNGKEKNYANLHLQSASVVETCQRSARLYDARHRGFLFVFADSVIILLVLFLSFFFEIAPSVLFTLGLLREP